MTWGALPKARSRAHSPPPSPPLPPAPRVSVVETSSPPRPPKPALLFLKALPLTLPDVRASNAPGEFDAARAKERLARILGGETPHPVDTDENDAVRERLFAEIEALGFKPEVRDDFSCRSERDRSRAVCA